MRIIKPEEAQKLETVKGRHGVILVVGERAMMMKLTVEPGIPTPPHAYPHEQMGHLLQGEGILYVGDESRRITAGTSFWIPPEAPHNFDATGRLPSGPHLGLQPAERGLPGTRRQMMGSP